MRSRGGASSALGAERAERERERAALLRHARDEAERSLQLAAALSARDTQLRHAREQLFEASCSVDIDSSFSCRCSILI